MDGTSSDHITFSKFILVSANHQELLLTNHNLNLAFQLFDREGLGLMDVQGMRIALGENLTPEDEDQLVKSMISINKQYNEPDEDCLSFETFILHMKDRKDKVEIDSLQKVQSKIGGD